MDKVKPAPKPDFRDPEYDRQMKAAERVMRENREALKRLAK